VIEGRALIELIIASVAIILIPGPSVMFVIARAVAWGRITAVLTALGNALGMLLLSVFIAIGLGPLLQRSELLLMVVQVLGGLYLIHLGIDAYRHRQEHADDMIKIEEVKPSNFQILRQGFTVGALNPKALVFFSAVSSGWHVGLASWLKSGLVCHFKEPTGSSSSSWSCCNDGTWHWCHSAGAIRVLKLKRQQLQLELLPFI